MRRISKNVGLRLRDSTSLLPLVMGVKLTQLMGHFLIIFAICNHTLAQNTSVPNLADVQTRRAGGQLQLGLHAGLLLQQHGHHHSR